MLLLKVVEGEPFLFSSASSGSRFPWLAAASLQSLPLFSHGFPLSASLCVSVSYKDTLIGFRAQPNLI